MLSDWSEILRMDLPKVPRTLASAATRWLRIKDT